MFKIFNKKQLVVIGVVVLITFCAGVFFIFNQRNTAKSTVAVSIYPYYLLSKEILPENEIYLVSPTSVDPHDFSPSGSQVQDIYSSQLFMYNGQIDSWAKDFQEVNSNITKPKIINFESLGVSFEGESEYSYDPHIWLDFKNAYSILETMSNELSSINPGKKEFYENQLKNAKLVFDELDQNYRTSLSNCSKNTILVDHNAYNYLAKNYGFNVISFYNSEDADPSLEEVQNIENNVKELDIKYLLTNNSEMNNNEILQNANLEILNFSSLESGELNESYSDKARKNLETLVTALECNSNS